jgi:hypothetical protein
MQATKKADEKKNTRESGKRCVGRVRGVSNNVTKTTGKQSREPVEEKYMLSSGRCLERESILFFSLLENSCFFLVLVRAIPRPARVNPIWPWWNSKNVPFTGGQAKKTLSD